MKKKIIDVLLTVLLLFLMAYQVTGEVLHEWLGIAMTVLLVIHHILNRKWYGSLFKGKYNAYRALTVCMNTFLLASIALTAFCGMSMSGYAVPFLYGMTSVSFARRFHLAMSHWAFVLMGLHLGLHIPAMLAKWKLSNKARMILSVIFACISGYGLFLFLRSGMTDYMFFRNAFAFLDYDKAKWLVILENLLMLVFWAFIGTQLAGLCRSRAKKQNPLLPVVFILLAVVIGMSSPGGKVYVHTAATIGVPLYACGGGTIPLIRGWLQDGMSIGSAAAFMITGPATKITNLGALKIVFGLRRFLLYLGFIMVYSFLCGMIVNLII